MSAKLQLRAKVASLSRSRAADDPEFLEAQRDLAFEAISDYLVQRLSITPALTIAQQVKIANLLSQHRR